MNKTASRCFFSSCGTVRVYVISYRGFSIGNASGSSNNFNWMGTGARKHPLYRFIIFVIVGFVVYIYPN